MCVFQSLILIPAVLDFTTKTTNNNKNAHFNKKRDPHIKRLPITKHGKTFFMVYHMMILTHTNMTSIHTHYDHTFVFYLLNFFTDKVLHTGDGL